MIESEAKQMGVTQIPIELKLKLAEYADKFANGDTLERGIVFLMVSSLPPSKPQKNQKLT
jgi:hypothetical protein